MKAPIIAIIILASSELLWATPINGTKPDTIDSKQIVINLETLVKIERENAELKVLVQSIRDENDKRTGTLLWGAGIIVSLLTVLIAGSAFKANQTAKEAAKEEFNKELATYKEAFEQLKQEQKMQIQEFSEAINAIKG